MELIFHVREMYVGRISHEEEKQISMGRLYKMSHYPYANV